MSHTSKIIAGIVLVLLLGLAGFVFVMNMKKNTIPVKPPLTPVTSSPEKVQEATALTPDFISLPINMSNEEYGKEMQSILENIKTGKFSSEEAIAAGVALRKKAGMPEVLPPLEEKK